MIKNKYLFEIGVEELPANYILPAIDFMVNYFSNQLQNHKIKFESIEKYSTPRRLTIIIRNLPNRQKDSQKEIIGPPKKIAFDSNRNFNQVGLGFLKKQNLSKKDIVIKKLKKGEYLSATKVIKGKITEEILKQISIEIIGKIQFPKTMRWSENSISFARPIRWILAIFNQNILDFQFGNIRSNSFSFGNRFENLHNKLTINSIDGYKSKLEKHFVIVEREKRKKIILNQLNETASKVNGIPADNPELVETVTDLVEFPSPVLGEFDKDFLELPAEVLKTTLSETQKCFSLYDKKGNLLPNFICIANSNPKTIQKVKYGNERVINARLSDAKFYFETDKKTKLVDRIEITKKTTFQKKLGSYFDKTERMKELSKFLAKNLNFEAKKIARAIQLSKTDLTTLMLGEKEYTKLQGFIGWQYALSDKENDEVAKAIFEQYLPRYKDDILPETQTGIALSLVDKMDTICGCFSIGLIPSGSSDPLALRRAGNGIIRILDKHNLPISIIKFIEKSLTSFEKISKDEHSAASKLLDFFSQRVKKHLENYKIEYDVIDAVMESGFANIPDTILRAKNLQNLKSKDEFRKLIIGFKRVTNILSSSKNVNKLDTKLFEKNEEISLYQKMNNLAPKYQKYVESQNYQKALNMLIALKDDIDDFFDNVMVMVKDEKIRENRMALLRLLNGHFVKIADLSKIVYEI
ncbi:MAG: glycine--tRNA ligase subunit beta [Candidatus Cloacimonetes bacterium]|nr:glycine--tRNA ligase subunit beta [Candidatus Cloacimonadota bacterium]